MRHLYGTVGLEELSVEEQKTINGGDENEGLLFLLVIAGLLIWGLITGDIEVGPYEEPEPMPFPEYM
jgi:hypothetical protein